MAIATAEAACLMLHRRRLVMAMPRRETAALAHLVRRVINCVFASKRIKLALHKEVEEEACSCIVCHVTIEVDGPEERVTLRRGRIRERH